MNSFIRLFALSLLFSFVALAGCQKTASNRDLVHATKLPAPELKRMSYEQYGIDLQSKQVILDTLEEGQFMQDVLLAQGITPERIDLIERKAVSVFDVRRMRAGAPISLIKDPQTGLNYFIYEKNPASYVVFDLRDSIRIYEGARKVVSKDQGIAGFINSTLFETIKSKGMEIQLAKLLEEIFAWSVDFSHLDVQDYFRVVYEEAFVDEVSIGISKVVAAHFHHRGKDYYAIYFNPDTAGRYFDENGNSVQRAFLRTPLKYTAAAASEVSPPTNRGSYAQDFAATRGTPILAVGDGEIAWVADKKSWGRSVRINHGQVYATEYLRLGKYLEGIEKGLKVKQGDVIGYVGNNESGYLGSFTFRFWKQGKPTHPDNIDMPDYATPVDSSMTAQFEEVKKAALERLQQIPLESSEEEAMTANE